MRNFFSKIKVLFVLCAVCLCAFIGGGLSLKNQPVEANAAENITITQVQFRSNNEHTQYYFFLRMAGQTDYTTANQWHNPDFVTSTNILDKVTVYFLNGSGSLRDIWSGVNVGTYVWGDDHTLVFPLKEGYEANMGVGARIEAGAEIPMNNGEKKVTATSRSFWTNGTAYDIGIDNYVEGYNTIPTTLEKVHLRGEEGDIHLLIGLGEGNDWNNKGEAICTQAKAADGTSNYASDNWMKLYLSNFTSKIKLHVKETDTWVTYGSIIRRPEYGPQWFLVYNGWAEDGGIVRLKIDNNYNGQTVDKILFEEGCELPSYEFNGNNISHTVHVLEKNYLYTSNDMSTANWAVAWTVSNYYNVTFNGSNAVVVGDGEAVAYPYALSEKKEADAYGSYVYNWYLNGELYDFSKPVTSSMNLTSNGTFTTIPAEYKVTYYALDGKTVLYEDVYTYNETITYREVGDVVGYDYCMWKYNGEGAVPTQMPAKDISFIIQGVAKTYGLTFVNEEGKKVYSGNVTYAETIGSLPETAEKVGYEGFWAIDGEKITEDTIWLFDGNKIATLGYEAKKFVLTFAYADSMTMMAVTYDAAIGALADLPASADEHFLNVWTIDGEEITAATVWNYAENKTAVLGAKPVEYTVTFDGENACQYAYGALIAKPADPTKEGTKECDFVFDGWYNGETKWNFETDTVAGNMNLVARYNEVKRMYTVSFNIIGRDDIKLESVQVAYGTNYDLMNLFTDKQVKGYFYSVTVNGVDKASVKVTGNVTVDIAFTKALEGEEDVTVGCFGSVSGLGVAAIGLCAIALFKKKEN